MGADTCWHYLSTCRWYRFIVNKIQCWSGLIPSITKIAKSREEDKLHRIISTCAKKTHVAWHGHSHLIQLVRSHCLSKKTHSCWADGSSVPPKCVCLCTQWFFDNSQVYKVIKTGTPNNKHLSSHIISPQYVFSLSEISPFTSSVSRFSVLVLRTHWRFLETWFAPDIGLWRWHGMSSCHGDPSSKRWTVSTGTGWNDSWCSANCPDCMKPQQAPNPHNDPKRRHAQWS